MISRDRMMTTINCEEPDRVPVYLRLFERNFLIDEGIVWRNQFERAKIFLRLDLDDALSLHAPLTINSDLEVKVVKKSEDDEKYPLIFKEYHTSRGVLKQVVRMTRDWPHGEDIPTFDDYIVPRARTKKYLVEREEDLDALSVLFARPSGLKLESFLKEAEKVGEFAEVNGVLVEGWGPMGGDAAVWLCGIEKTIKWAFEEPKLMDRLLKIVLEWDLQSIELLSRTKCVDLIVHRGWYENTHFWPPRLYRKFIAPMLKKEAEEAHKRGLKFGYIVTTGIMHILNDIVDCGVDLLLGVDPIQDRVDLNVVKERLDGRVCIWGGVNSAVTLRSSSEIIGKTVKEAIGKLAPGGGFILGPVDAVFKDTPPQGLKAFIDAWRRIHSYPYR
ncbi:MAG: uroporphyrinogen decarboxylase family protein [Candidatus Bathyarchaeia archaeon]